MDDNSIEHLTADHIREIKGVYEQAKVLFSLQRKKVIDEATLVKECMPFVERLKKYNIDFHLAKMFDSDFFGTSSTGCHWWGAFGYPNVMDVLKQDKFSYPIPECGFTVISHGLLTMHIVINNPDVVALEYDATLEAPLEAKIVPDEDVDGVATDDFEGNHMYLAEDGYRHVLDDSFDEYDADDADDEGYESL